MKLEIIAAAIIAGALITPTFAEDKPVADAPKADAPKARANTPSKRHSHVEVKHGINPTDQPVSDSKPLDRSKHFHPRDR